MTTKDKLINKIDDLLRDINEQYEGLKEDGIGSDTVSIELFEATVNYFSAHVTLFHKALKKESLAQEKAVSTQRAEYSQDADDKDVVSFEAEPSEDDELIEHQQEVLTKEDTDEVFFTPPTAEPDQDEEKDTDASEELATDDVEDEEPRKTDVDEEDEGDSSEEEDDDESAIEEEDKPEEDDESQEEDDTLQEEDDVEPAVEKAEEDAEEVVDDTEDPEEATETVTNEIDPDEQSNGDPDDDYFEEDDYFDEDGELIDPNEEEEVEKPLPDVVTGDEDEVEQDEEEDVRYESTADVETSDRDKEEVVHEVVIAEKQIEVPLSAVANEPASGEPKPNRPLTINEIISAQRAKSPAPSYGGTTARLSTASNERVKDIKSLISLNDKLLFIKDLFNGYSLAYSEAIELINRYDDFDAARVFLEQNYAQKNNWADKANTADKLYAVMRKRFG